MPPPSSIARWARRLALPALLWWAISGGDPDGWRWGLPAVVVAALVMPAPTWPLRPLAWLRFLPAALWLGLQGGIEVACLACRRPLELDTRVIEHRWQQLPDGPGRLFMASLINLIPGTLSVRIEHDRLHVHVLHYRHHIPTALQRLERRVAPLFAPPRTSEKEAR
ncbi:Na+/H+ antiporter subunit E [Halomonas sp. E14]|uniref:Na+/H+ antiporter subunit E n=1 Tax=Halomonas sp. E14 TaxID=3397245 RepID=UPI00403E4C1F